MSGEAEGKERMSEDRRLKKSEKGMGGGAEEGLAVTLPDMNGGEGVSGWVCAVWRHMQKNAFTDLPSLCLCVSE